MSAVLPKGVVQMQELGELEVAAADPKDKLSDFALAPNSRRKSGMS
jgi:hypothetical protein